MTIPVLRFAPSPNGPLHLGHALSALYGFETARRLGGRFLLRIEDIDVTRSQTGFIDGIYADMAWLGITFEKPVFIQSEHFPDYLAAAERLIGKGLLYPCFATRSDIASKADPAKSDPDGVPLYPGIWRNKADIELQSRIASGEQPSLRLNMPVAREAVRQRLGGAQLTFTELADDGATRTVNADPARWGDAIVVRKDVPASYHLAVVVDDARQGVTHVTRGQDLFAATDIQRMLQVLLGFPEPNYTHHRLMAAPDGRKLSKSLGARSLKTLREAGATPADIRRMVGMECPADLQSE
jgi:glutamyl-Q tRNA(Asp) synthetase